MSDNLEGALEELRRAAEVNDQTFDADAALKEIEGIIADCQAMLSQARQKMTPAARRDHYDKLLKTVQKAKALWQETFNTPDTATPLVSAWGEDYVWIPDVAEEVIDQLTIQERCLEAALEIASDSVSSAGGRTKGSRVDPVISHLVQQCADCWEFYIQADVGFSRPSDGGNPSGPFIRFVQAVAAEAGASALSANLAEYAAHQVRRRDSETAKIRRTRLSERYGSHIGKN